jgi:hypothetical protein
MSTARQLTAVAFRYEYVTVIGISFTVLTLVVLRLERHVADVRSEARIFEIQYALERYREEFGCDPPLYIADANQRPLYSWRVLLPCVGGNSLYDQFSFDKAWNDPSNLALVSSGWALNSSVYRRDHRLGAFTDFAAINCGLPPRDITACNGNDQTEKRLIVIELKASRIIWSQPDDVEMSYVDAIPQSDYDRTWISRDGRIEHVSRAIIDDLHLDCARRARESNTVRPVPEASKDRMMANLSSDEFYSRHEALLILGQCAWRDQEAMAMLDAALRDGDVRIRKAANLSLEKIRKRQGDR